MDKAVNLYDATKLYAYIEAVATDNKMNQTLLALPLMKQLHEGQFRCGNRLPYIVHPLFIAKHALALGLYDDSLIAATLLHDVVEDCGVTSDTLPISDEAKELVDLVSFFEQPGMTKAEAKKIYFEKIAANKKAAVLKVLDRCNNVSSMGETFTEKRLQKYIVETEEYILPLIDIITEQYPEYKDVAFVSKYQIVSMLQTIKRFLKEDTLNE